MVGPFLVTHQPDGTLTGLGTQSSPVTAGRTEFAPNGRGTDCSRCSSDRLGTGCAPRLTYADDGIYWAVARASTTSDVFNALADVHRRDILDALITGEKAVGTIVDNLAMPQPQVSKHLRVLSEVGLVRCRAEGRRRLYRLEPARLRPLQEWLTKYERAMNDRLDRLDDYLKELQQKGEPQ
jgi:DNA-binding transcriptional ArsR family regulator